MKTKQLVLLSIAIGLSFISKAQFGTYLDGGAQNGFTFGQVRSIGIGIFDATSANTTTEARLHVRNEYLAQPTNAAFDGFLFRTDGNTSVNNKWHMFTGTAGAFNEIFKLEVPSAAPNTFLLQSSQSGGDIRFNTGGANFRAIITSAGAVGINTLTPANQLEVNSGVSNTSGVRLSQLKITSPAPTTATAVLSVDASGDVILVQPGGIVGTVSADNGLNNTSGPVQIGGTLIQHTDVDLNSFNMAWEGTGIFGVGDGITASGLSGSKMFVNTSTIPVALRVENNYPSSGAQLTAGSFVTTVNNTHKNIGVHGSAAGSDIENNAGYFYALGSSTLTSTKNTAVQALAEESPDQNFGGVFRAVSSSPNALINTGLSAQAVSGFSNYGVSSSAVADANNTIENIGMYSEVNSGTGSVRHSIALRAWTIANTPYTKYGVSGNISPTNDDGNIAVAGVVGNATYDPAAISASLNIGVFGKIQYHPSFPLFDPQLPNNFAGYFDGDVYIKGSYAATTISPVPPYAGNKPALEVEGNAVTTGGSWYLASDKRYKTDIKKLESAGEKLSKLSGYTYKFNEQMPDGKKNWNNREQIGLIAQEIKEVFPQLILENKDGYMAVNYQGLVPILLEGFKEQQATITSQQEQINALKTQMQTLLEGKNGGESGRSSALIANHDLTLNNKNMLVLDQNTPNPFAENTSIHYNIPEDFKSAQIRFVTNDGKLIKTFEITEKGEGVLNVFANDLTHGLYAYSLIIDGKIVDTKRMIKN